VWSAISTLLGWEVIFAPVEGCFRHGMQTAPLDWGTPHFLRSRREPLTRLLRDISGATADRRREMVTAAWLRHCGKAAVGISWGGMTLEAVRAVAGAFPGGVVATVCGMLLAGGSAWRGGMPDLVMVSQCGTRGRMVEVKSPRDRLSDQQVAWLRSMERAGADVAVLKVLADD